jgi:hypothetical protein
MVAACCSNLVAELITVTWDSENNKITTLEEKDEDARFTVCEKANFISTSRSFLLAQLRKRTLTEPLKHYSILMRPIRSILYMLRMMQIVLQLEGPQTVIHRKKIQGTLHPKSVILIGHPGTWQATRERIAIRLSHGLCLVLMKNAVPVKR